MKKVDIYTDGACKGNPGHGGWAAILVYAGHERILSGGERVTTNNRMELIAAIEGLRALREPCEVTLHSDSRYLVDAINLGWLSGWKAAGWKRGKETLKNPDLWQQLDELLSRHEVTMNWVKGHDGHTYNERCDELATRNAALFSQAEPYDPPADSWPSKLP